ncbi:cytochrome b561 and DOMON domain-containing protein At3g07570-like [Neltuma alba]|uniref:cytochrome b561 and DOMON domain-containing protein At3g07570-like n=1 Tax=Neltuma alba TaxID=207710 RepID=UPI0010A4B6FD|nr:cytochrome b561 and DOMON domain-containing protein At3g07570-like [Prosopis alba]
MERHELRISLQILLLIFFFFFTLHCYLISSQQTDSCTCNLNLQVPIPFDTSNLHCLSVWDSQGFILRYVQTSSNLWSFILSTPDTNSYIAMGFSADGGMAGSSAMVGWVAAQGSSGGIKQYYLGGLTPDQVVPDKGNLQVIGNSSFITMESGRVYMVFQLATTTTASPSSFLLFATGPTGLFPSAPSYRLVKHLDKVSIRINYTSGSIGNSQSQASGGSSSSSSSSSSPSSSSTQLGDSCGNKLNLNGVFPFDTTNLNCFPVWNAQDFILRYSQSSSYVWSFIVSAPDKNSYIAMGFSPNGGMVGSSAIVGWVPSTGSSAAGLKQYYLGGTSPSQVVPDRGNLQLVANSTVITSQSSRLFLAFQLQTAQPPLSRLIFAVGPTGVFPSAPSFALAQHQDKASTTFNYATATGSSASSSSSLSGNAIVSLKRTHGLLNILGWGVLIIMGAIIARHFRQWDPLWFYFHVSFQTLGFILGVIGVITGLLLNNQLHANVEIHKALGITILVLGCLQMMAILGRPNKDTKARKYWNLYHHNTGRILIIIAIANIFYGIHLGHEGSAWRIGYGIVLAILLFIAFIFEMRKWSDDEDDDDD